MSETVLFSASKGWSTKNPTKKQYNLTFGSRRGRGGGRGGKIKGVPKKLTL